MSSLVLGSIAYDNLFPHSTLFCNHPNRNFWSARFWRFYAVFQCDIQSAHWKIEKSSFAFSTVVCLIWLSKFKVRRLVVKCAVYVFRLFHLFPHTEKWVCREIYLKRSSANYPRKYAVLGFLPWQQNHALNVQRAVRFDFKILKNCSFKMPVQVKKSIKSRFISTRMSKKV